MSKSEFHDWFIAQFGRRPGGLISDRALFARVKAGEEADAVLNQRDEWDDARNAALKGYVAGMDRQNVMFATKRRRVGKSEGQK